MKILDLALTPFRAVKSFFTSPDSPWGRWTGNWSWGSVAWSSRSYTALAEKAYNNPYAARGLRLTAQAMNDVPIVAEGASGEVVERSEYAALMQNPWPEQPRGYFFDAFVAHVYCAGRVFVDLAAAPDTGTNKRRPKRLRLIPPNHFERIEENQQTGEAIKYHFRTAKGRPFTRTPEEVIDLRIYNPADPDGALPLLTGAARALQMMEASDEWNLSISNARGRVPLFLKLNADKVVTKEQMKELQDQMDERYKERSSEGLPMVVNSIFDELKTDPVSPKDAEFLESGRESMRRIAAVLGWPATILGDVKAGSLTDSGVDSEMEAGYKLTVLPLYKWFLDGLNSRLAPVYGHSLRYDTDGIPALQEDENDAVKRGVQATGGPVMTVDEWREGRKWKALGGDAAVLRQKAVVQDRPEDADRVAEARRSLSAKGMIHLISEAA